MNLELHGDMNFTSRSLASFIKERDIFAPDMSCKQYILVGHASNEKKCFPSKDLSGELLVATIEGDFPNENSTDMCKSEILLSSEVDPLFSELPRSDPMTYASAVLRSTP
jgi:hypothetical protein